MEIVAKDLEYKYQANTPFEKLALYDVNVTIPPHSYTAVIGHTGSGKSTLLQHFNGLLQPTGGKIQIGDVILTAGKKGAAGTQTKGRYCFPISGASIV